MAKTTLNLDNVQINATWLEQTFNDAHKISHLVATNPFDILLTFQLLLNQLGNLFSVEELDNLTQIPPIEKETFSRDWIDVHEFKYITQSESYCHICAKHHQSNLTCFRPPIYFIPQGATLLDSLKVARRTHWIIWGFIYDIITCQDCGRLFNPINWHPSGEGRDGMICYVNEKPLTAKDSNRPIWVQLKELFDHEPPDVIVDSIQTYQIIGYANGQWFEETVTFPKNKEMLPTMITSALHGEYRLAEQWKEYYPTEDFREVQKKYWETITPIFHTMIEINSDKHWESIVQAIAFSVFTELTNYEESCLPDIVKGILVQN